MFRPQTVKADGGGDSAAGVQMPLLVSWDTNSLHVLDPAAILESGGITEWHVDLGQIVSLSVRCCVDWGTHVVVAIAGG